MQLPESFYIALCGTILLLGVIYWFWTQTQYIQRKVNLLENVVYEIKTLVSNLPGHSGHQGQQGQQGQQRPMDEEEDQTQEQEQADDLEHEPVITSKPYAPPPESVAGDLEEERNNSENEFTAFVGATSSNNVVTKHIDELSPGGLASPAEKPMQDIGSIDKSLESPLQTMTTKELRRMAEASGVPGASELKKKDLVKVLRDKVGTLIQSSEKSANIMSFDEISAPLSE